MRGKWRGSAGTFTCGGDVFLSEVTEVVYVMNQRRKFFFLDKKG